MEKQPLVSIVVITYNSAEYVLETLNSVLGQTYPNIEIIISDDCSKDNTVSLCRKWINEHSSSGIAIQLLEAPHNTGTAANNNRGLKAAHGEWIKFIAGDDLLLPTCIKDNVNYVLEHEGAEVVFSNYESFKFSNGKKVVLAGGSNEKLLNFSQLDSHQQFLSLLKKNILPAVTSFINANIFKDLSFDERYKFLEDIPLWIKVTQTGKQLHYFPVRTVQYRVGESLSKSQSGFFSPLFIESNILYFWNERRDMIKQHNLNEAYQYHRKAFFMSEVAELLFNNKRNVVTNALYRIIYWMVNHWMNFKF